MLYLLLLSSKLTYKNKIKLFKSMIRSTLTYASAAWSHASKTTISKLQVVQNRSLRAIVQSDWYMTTVQIHEDTEMEYLVKIFEERKEKTWKKIEISDNPLVKNIGQLEHGNKKLKLKTPRPK